MARAKKAIRTRGPDSERSRLLEVRNRVAAYKNAVLPKRDAAEVMERVEAFLDKIAPDVVKRLASAEARANHAETELQWLRSRLVGLLSSDQIEAAKICSMAPEHYAIEHIQLWKERMFAECPVSILPLSTLKMGYHR